VGISILEDTRLYVDHLHYRQRFEWPMKTEPGARLRYHLIWDGRLTRHHELCLKSLLVSQGPPLDVSFWLPGAVAPESAVFLGHLRGVSAVTVRPCVPEEEARGTPFEGRLELLRPAAPRRPSDASDALRLLLLFKYGGVYADLDTVFLRDLRPLSAVEFCYQWSNTRDANNAFLHFHAGSEVLRELIERSLRLGSAYPRQLFRLDEIIDVCGDLWLLPVFIFDPAWVANDRKIPDNPYLNSFPEFFASSAPVRLEDFFPGSYAYHWHNQWSTPIREDTIAGQLYRQVCERFDRLCVTNGWRAAMGEWTST
jgi:hypothetical protein